MPLIPVEAPRRRVHRLAGHVSGRRNDWYTPAHIVERARGVMGGIDLDPASSEIAQRTVQAAAWYGVGGHALQRPWQGRVWLNPPYSMPAVQQFVDKLLDEIARGRVAEAMLLVNAATDAGWFRGAAARADVVGFSRGRIRFVDPAGRPGSPLHGQALMYFGPWPARFVAAFQDVLWIPNAGLPASNGDAPTEQTALVLGVGPEP